MKAFFSLRTRATSWWHNIPLPPSLQNPPLFQEWHEYVESAKGWEVRKPRPDKLVTRALSQHGGDAKLSSMTHQSSKITIATWNVDFSSAHPETRISAIIDHLQNHGSTLDVIFFQEVSRVAHATILGLPWIQSAWLVSDVQDSSWEGQSFASITLLSKARFVIDDLDSNNYTLPVWRLKYSSRFGRDALCCDVFVPAFLSTDTTDTQADLPPELVRIRLINVHLDSLAITPSCRPNQIATVAAMLRVAGKGVVAGDFNPVLPQDNTLVSDNHMMDAWAEIRPTDSGFTWGVDGTAPFPPGRLDKVAMVGLTPTAIETLVPGVLQDAHGDKDTVGTKLDSQSTWSDHHGLICTFDLTPNDRHRSKHV